MTNRIILFLSALLLVSCQPGAPKKSKEQEKAELDSFTIARYGRTSEEQVQHITDSVIASAALDTTGLHKAPLKVEEAKISKMPGHAGKTIILWYRNLAKKG